jgi:hypothetical protein
MEVSTGRDANHLHAEVVELRTLNRAEDAALSVSIDTGAQNDSRGEELRNISQLPPVDRGKAAWGFVFGGLLIEGLGWGESCPMSLHLFNRLKVSLRLCLFFWCLPELFEQSRSIQS